MRILGVETSCDDTCVAVVEAIGQKEQKIPRFKILSNIVSSQVKIHREYGGVVPSLAKRAHQENLVPALERALRETGALTVFSSPQQHSNTGYGAQQFSIFTHFLNSKLQTLSKILEREPELQKQFLQKVTKIKKPKIDLIAVTNGPGLEPALWAGVNFAKALSYVWKTPLLGINHMEGHISANFLEEIGGNPKFKIPTTKQKIIFPALCLAVSGGHTQLILIHNILKYKLLGETLDDAAGEAFDKVARLLGLSFPGGPEIAKAAKGGDSRAFDFPRPMRYDKNYNFSFSGLKTSVLYTVAKLAGTVPAKLRKDSPLQLGMKEKKDIAASFQQAAIDVLIAKTMKAAREYNAKTIMLAGGVAANEELRRQLGKEIKKELPVTDYRLPAASLSTDNAAMIAAAAYFKRNNATLTRWKTLKADGNLKISENQV